MLQQQQESREQQQKLRNRAKIAPREIFCAIDVAISRNPSENNFPISISPARDLFRMEGALAAASL